MWVCPLGAFSQFFYFQLLLYPSIGSSILGPLQNSAMVTVFFSSWFPPPSLKLGLITKQVEAPRWQVRTITRTPFIASVTWKSQIINWDWNLVIKMVLNHSCLTAFLSHRRLSHGCQIGTERVIPSVNSSEFGPVTFLKSPCRKQTQLLLLYFQTCF